jgi:hypothetical protein
MFCKKEKEKKKARTQSSRLPNQILIVEPRLKAFKCW